MAKTPNNAAGGGNKHEKPSKMPGVGFGEGFKKTDNDPKKKDKPGEKRPPKSSKKQPKGPGQIGK
jgi:hypothetical protein